MCELIQILLTNLHQFRLVSPSSKDGSGEDRVHSF